MVYSILSWQRNTWALKKPSAAKKVVSIKDDMGISLP